MTVAREVGISLQIHQAIREKKYGYFAKILIKVDFHGDLLEIFTVELSDYGFNVEVHYESLPSRCNHCNHFGAYNWQL